MADRQAGLDSGQDVQRRNEWPEQLRDACELLLHTPAHVIATISVTDRLCGVPDEARLLEALGRRLGEEYGLQAAVHVGERAATIHFRRGEASG